MHSWNHLVTRSVILLSSITAITTASIFLQPGVAATPDGKNDRNRRNIVLPGRTDKLPFSDGVLVRDTLYLAGRIGIDPQSGKPPEDLEKEIRLLLDGMKGTLAAADLTMDDLVSVQIFCPDLSLYEKFNEIYATYFTGKFPARAFIGSGPLLRGGRFEAQGIAVRR